MKAHGLIELNGRQVSSAIQETMPVYANKLTQ